MHSLAGEPHALCGWRAMDMHRKSNVYEATARRGRDRESCSKVGGFIRD